MAGTVAGGKAAAESNIKRYGEDYYKLMGQRGGRRCVPKGFAMNHKLASIAGARGGRISRRPKKTTEASTHD